MNRWTLGMILAVALGVAFVLFTDLKPAPPPAKPPTTIDGDRSAEMSFPELTGWEFVETQDGTVQLVNETSRAIMDIVTQKTEPGKDAQSIADSDLPKIKGTEWVTSATLSTSSDNLVEIRYTIIDDGEEVAGTIVYRDLTEIGLTLIVSGKGYAKDRENLSVDVQKIARGVKVKFD